MGVTTLYLKKIENLIKNLENPIGKLENPIGKLIEKLENPIENPTENNIYKTHYDFGASRSRRRRGVRFKGS